MQPQSPPAPINNQVPSSTQVSADDKEGGGRGGAVEFSTAIRAGGDRILLRPIFRLYQHYLILFLTC